MRLGRGRPALLRCVPRREHKQHQTRARAYTLTVGEKSVDLAIPLASSDTSKNVLELGPDPAWLLRAVMQIELNEKGVRS